MSPSESPLADVRPKRAIIGTCLTGLALLAVLTVPFYSTFGLHVNWASMLPYVSLLATLVGLTAYLVRHPGPPRERAFGDVTGAMSLIVALLILLTPAQYLAVAQQRPLIDHWLAAADALMGVHVPSLTDWTRAHPFVDQGLRIAYFSLGAQFVATPLLLGIAFKSAQRVWEFTFHFFACLLVALAALAVFPAACAFQFYGFESTIDQARFIAHFNGVREGVFNTIHFDDLEGLVSMPSFHVAGGIFVTWAFRDRVAVASAVGLLNLGLMAATVLTGAHYFIDLLASAILFAVSVLAYDGVTRLATTRTVQPSTAVVDALSP